MQRLEKIKRSCLNMTRGFRFHILFFRDSLFLFENKNHVEESNEETWSSKRDSASSAKEECKSVSITSPTETSSASARLRRFDYRKLKWTDILLCVFLHTSVVKNSCDAAAVLLGNCYETDWWFEVSGNDRETFLFVKTKQCRQSLVESGRREQEQEVYFRCSLTRWFLVCTWGLLSHTKPHERVKLFQSLFHTLSTKWAQFSLSRKTH
jgi:hypothetical protein